MRLDTCRHLGLANIPNVLWWMLAVCPSTLLLKMWRSSKTGQRAASHMHACCGLTEHGIQEVWWLVVSPLRHRERPAAHVRELAATGHEVGSCDLPRPEILPYSGPLPVTGQRKHNYLWKYYNSNEREKLVHLTGAVGGRAQSGVRCTVQILI